MRLTDAPCCLCGVLTVGTVPHIGRERSHRVPCCDLCRVKPARELFDAVCIVAAELDAQTAQRETNRPSALN